MAILFPYLELVAALFILLLAFHIYTRHYANRAAQFYSRLALLIFVSVIFEYSMRIAFTLEFARNLDRITNTLWAFLFPMFAHFTLIFCHKEKWLKNKFSYLLLYAPAATLAILFLFTDLMFLRYEILSFGIVSVPSPWFLLFVANNLFYAALGVGILLVCARKGPQKIIRNQSYLIAAGVGIAALIGLVFDGILPAVFGVVLPPTVVFDAAILSFFIYLAMRRYSLFAISPALAADTILETMPDTLLVTDLSGRVLVCNDEAHKYFHAPKEEILGKHIQSLFEDKSHFKKLYEETVEKGLEIERFEAKLCDSKGECLPSLINANALHDAIGALLGIVFVIRDTRG